MTKTKCPMCAGDLKHTELNGTQIWSCSDCPIVMFEFYDNKDTEKMGNYLKQAMWRLI